MDSAKGCMLSNQDLEILTGRVKSMERKSSSPTRIWVKSVENKGSDKFYSQIMQNNRSFVLVLTGGAVPGSASRGLQ